MDWYHYAFSLKQLAKIHITEDQAPSWVGIEKELSEPIPVQAFISQSGGEVPSKNPLLSFARETWQASHRLTGLNPSFTRRSSLWHNNLLKVGKKNLYWKSWVEAGIIYIGDVFEGNNLMNFTHLANKYNIPKRDFWKYLQLRSCIRAAQQKLPLLPQTELQKLMQGDQGVRSGASRYYSLIRQSHPPKLEGLKRAWEADLRGEIAMEKWKDITGSWYRISREMQTRLIRYKIIHRVYWTPCKMARLKLCESETCWRCERSRGTLLHMLYECELTQNFWGKITSCISKALRTEIIPSPALCILGLIPEGVELSSQQILWCRLALTTGCRIVLRHWKSKNEVPFNEWVGEMTKVASYEVLIARQNNREEEYRKIWDPYMMSL